MTVTALNEPLSTTPAAIPAPKPPALPDGRLLAEVDPELYAAWRTHISQGFTNNNIMFGRVLNAFLYPYWLTVALYVTLILVGVGLFLLGVWLAIGRGEAMFGVISGGSGNRRPAELFCVAPPAVLGRKPAVHHLDGGDL